WRQPARLRPTFRTFRGLLRTPTFAGSALAGGLGMAAMFAYISGSSFVLQDLYGMSPQKYSIMFGVNAVGMVAAGQINARLVGRVGTAAQLLTWAQVSASLAGAILVTTVLLELP